LLDGESNAAPQQAFVARFMTLPTALLLKSMAC
jgi:hypothetical protein